MIVNKKRRSTSEDRIRNTAASKSSVSVPDFAAADIYSAFPFETDIFMLLPSLTAVMSPLKQVA